MFRFQQLYPDSVLNVGRGSSAAKLPDHFPQRNCLGAIWHRYNFQENRGEICIPSIRDAQAPGEIYLCQLCGDVTFHSTVLNLTT